MKITRLPLMITTFILIGVSIVAVAAYRTSATAQTASFNSAIVQTDKGMVKGNVGSTVRTFENIPYAAPPVKQLRWQSPQPALAWSGVRDATKRGNACMQGTPGSLDPNTHQSEDCLYLNVTTGLHTSSTSRKPVFVWVHGGGFTADTAANYNPTRIVEQGDVVAVTVNYRLGMFGAYAQAGLDGAGDFGLLDQQAALRWVQRNIQNFGGDPHNITLAGESAGGVSACGQLTSPTARGLFNKVIMESGSCDTNISLTAPGTDKITPPGTILFEPLSVAEEKSQAAATQLGCGNISPDDTLTCLRAKDETTIQKKMNLVSTPAYNTLTLPMEPGQAIQQGHTIHVPVLSGANQDESRLVIMSSILTGYPVTAQRYNDVLQQAFGSQAASIRAVYAPEKYKDSNGVPSYPLALSALQTDRDFVCPQYSTNEKLSWQMPVYTYNFADPHGLSSIPSFVPGFSMGAAHTSELFDLFDITPPPVNVDGTPQRLTAEQQQLAAAIINYWTTFAHSGTPNKGQLPYWAPYFPVAHQVLDLKPGQHGITTINGNVQHNCGLWQKMSKSSPGR